MRSRSCNIFFTRKVLILQVNFLFKKLQSIPFIFPPNECRSVGYRNVSWIIKTLPTFARRTKELCDSQWQRELLGQSKVEKWDREWKQQDRVVLVIEVLNSDQWKQSCLRWSNRGVTGWPTPRRNITVTKWSGPLGCTRVPEARGWSPFRRRWSDRGYSWAIPRLPTSSTGTYPHIFV